MSLAAELAALANRNADLNHGRRFSSLRMRAHLAQPGLELEVLRKGDRPIAALEIQPGGEIGIVADREEPVSTGRFLLRQLRRVCATHPFLWAVVQSNNLTVLTALRREGFAAFPVGQAVLLLRGTYGIWPRAD